MKIGSAYSDVAKLLFHDKPYLLLKTLYYDHSNSYAAMIAKRADCSYSYITKLIAKMERYGLVKTEDTKHKRMIHLTDKGKKIFELMRQVK